jgi:hypothetical protein
MGHPAETSSVPENSDGRITFKILVAAAILHPLVLIALVLCWLVRGVMGKWRRHADD